MKTVISAKNTSLTEAMKNNAEARLTHLNNHYPNINKATCVMKVAKNYCEVEIIVSGKKLFKVAKARTENMYLALHQAVDKLEIQLEKQDLKKYRKGLSLGEIEAERSEELLAS